VTGPARPRFGEGVFATQYVANAPSIRRKTFKGQSFLFATLEPMTIIVVGTAIAVAMIITTIIIIVVVADELDDACGVGVRGTPHTRSRMTCGQKRTRMAAIFVGTPTIQGTIRILTFACPRYAKVGVRVSEIPPFSIVLMP
jgi:hypothetical protein